MQTGHPVPTGTVSVFSDYGSAYYRWTTAK